MKDFILARFNQNYGLLGVLDTLHGTNAEFLKSVASKRHRTYASLLPIKYLIPDK